MIMTHIYHANRYFAIGLMLTLFSGLLLFGSAQAAYAGDRGFRQHEFRDTRYNHDRVYPARGYEVRALPRDHRVVVHGGARYYFSGGVWYRPHGPRFAVIAPPFGLFVPFLPPYYAMVWGGGRPYYYANEVYYVSQGNGYVVAEPPVGEVSLAPPPPTSPVTPPMPPTPQATSPMPPMPPAPPMSSAAPAVAPTDKLFIYPRQNQSEPQQATDRFDCHKWAVGQTGFDPTQPPGGVPESQRGQKQADYQRAMSACLEGRGYTVR
jgi:hypothetical protein